ncbi:MAG: hypothetical protein WCO63_16455 [Bacteroidota bacterium]
MTNKIKTWLIQDRAFDTGVRLFHAYGNRKSFSSTLNRQGYSPYNHALLIEELRKTAGISAVEIEDILSRPPQTPKKKKSVTKASPPEVSPQVPVDAVGEEVPSLEVVSSEEPEKTEEVPVVELAESLEDKKKDNLSPSKKESKSEKSSPS